MRRAMNQNSASSEFKRWWEVRTGLGGNFVDDFPVPPGRTIVLRRRTSSPVQGQIFDYIPLSVSLALDFETPDDPQDVSFVWRLVPRDEHPQARPPIARIEDIQAVGSLEVLYAELKHLGQSNPITGVRINLSYRYPWESERG